MTVNMENNSYSGYPGHKKLESEEKPLEGDPPPLTTGNRLAPLAVWIHRMDSHIHACIYFIFMIPFLRSDYSCLSVPVFIKH